MDDPAVDVVTDFSNCVILEPKLRSIDSVGNPRVSTTTEFFYVTNEKSKDPKLILSQPAAGSSLESRLMKYRISFHSQKHPGKLTMLTCVVRAVENYCPEQEQTLIAALNVAATVVHNDRAEVIRSIMTTGRIPDMDDKLKQTKLAELPGMKELMEDPKDEFVDSFEELIMESLCFVKDVSAQLKMLGIGWRA